MNGLLSAMYSALTSAGLTVYSKVPDNTPPPYAVIGEYTQNEWDTDGLTGFNITATVHTWSTSASMSEINTMMGSVYTALHRANLTVTGIIGIDFESSDLMRDADGVHLHGIQRFRVYIRG